MIKPTPNPPDTDPVTPSERIPSAADIQATPRKLCTMFIVNPELDTETLLAHACESLASARVVADDFAGCLRGSQRNTMLAISQMIMLGELAVIACWITSIRRVRQSDAGLNQSAIPVGAGLLAKRECQAALISPDTPLSRASPLPQVFVYG